ncbi:MAG: long-chain-fatty-acid--CoA ligase [Hyphomonadaceae bacterium]|nr:long-chain-fatty-acid--CoA ligase [Hyphomonadaceae bacterium]
MASLTSTLKRAVQIKPDGAATRYGTRTRTWREIAERVARLAGALVELGLRPDDRVAVISPNSERYLEIYFAVAWAGGVLTPVNWRWSEPEILQCFVDCTPRVVFADDTYLALAASLKDQCASVTHLVRTSDGAGPDAALDYEVLIEAASAIPDADRRNDMLAGLFYTGGTTGKSKGVMLSHANIMWSMLAYLAHTQPREDDVYLHAAPLFHVAGMASVFGITAAAGSHVFAPRFDPIAVLGLIEDHAVTVATFVPTMLQALLDTPGGAEVLRRRMRRMLYGASPISPALLQRAIDTLPDAEFIQCYGMTELAPIGTILSPTDHRKGSASLLSSAGRAAYGVEVRVGDDRGATLPRNAVGEILVRGPNVMLGYWNNSEETARAIREGWMRTGDAGYIDAEGYVYLVDRVKDMLVVGGENVYSVEVERVLSMLPEIVQCAVIGIPDEKWGERVHAVVVVDADSSVAESDIEAHCRRHLAGYKCPKSIEIRHEPLPLSGVGKILKGPLREPHWSGRQRRIG